MDKKAVIADILSLPVKDQLSILEVLHSRFGEDWKLTKAQEKEMARRLKRFDTEGFHGEPWDVLEKQLSKQLSRKST